MVRPRLLKIDSLMYFVGNLKIAAKFYEKVLGLKRAWKDQENRMIGFTFPEGDSEIVIHNDASLPNPDFSFLVEHVEEFCEEYRKKGYEIEMEPIEVRCGKYAVLLDPDANRIPIIDLTKFSGKPRYEETSV